MTIQFVQHASTTTTYTTGTTGTASPAFASNITAGNCVLACITTVTENNGQTITSVTTNGAAEHWAQVVAINPAEYLPGVIWANPNSAGGQKVIDVNWSFNFTATTSNSAVLLVDIYEFSGIGLAVPDQTASAFNNTGATSWSSGTTGTTAYPNELLIGMAGIQVATANTTTTVTGPGGSWTNEALLGGIPQQIGGTGTANAYNVYQLSGYQVTTSTGTATYNGTNGTSSAYGVLVAAFYANLPFRPANRAIQSRIPKRQNFPSGVIYAAPVSPFADLYADSYSNYYGIPQYSSSYSTGRISANYGAFPQNPNPLTGAGFIQKTTPVRIRVTPPPRGRVMSSRRGVTVTLTSGPAFTAAGQPVRAKAPRQEEFPAGLIYVNSWAGAP